MARPLEQRLLISGGELLRCCASRAMSPLAEACELGKHLVANK